MKYPEIALALGWTETPDLQEGIHLQPEEAVKIDQMFAANKTAVAEIQGQLTTATESIEAKKGKVAKLKTDIAVANTQLEAVTGQLATSKADLATAQARIAELEALETAKPSGTIAGEDPAASTLVDKAKYMTSYDTLFS